MKHANERPNEMEQDKRLADFTDRVMDGKVREVEVGVDEELQGLEETILRMKEAFPVMELNEARLKQMQVRLNVRMRRELGKVREPFWKKWFEPQNRLQFAMAIAAMGLVIVVLATSSNLFVDSSTTATALSPMKNSLMMMLAGVVLAVLWVWIKRRK
jgi:hypothetical protein